MNFSPPRQTYLISTEEQDEEVVKKTKRDLKDQQALQILKSNLTTMLATVESLEAVTNSEDHGGDTDVEDAGAPRDSLAASEIVDPEGENGVSAEGHAIERDHVRRRRPISRSGSGLVLTRSLPSSKVCIRPG